MDDRAELLRKDGYLLGIATLGLLNGQNFSPLSEGTFILLQPFWPSFLPASTVLLFYFSSLILAIGTVLAGGIGAALYERSNGLTETNTRSLQIWLLGTLALTIPAIGGMFNLF